MAENCADKLLEQYPELSKVEAKMLEEFFTEMEFKSNNAIEFANLQRDMTNQMERAAQERAVAEITHVRNLKRNMEHLLQPAFRGDPEMGANSLVLFTPYAANNQTLNAPSIATTTTANHISMLRQGLEKDGAINLIGDKEFDRNIFREFFDRVHGRPNKKYGSNVTGAVDTIISVNHSMVEGLRRAGSTIQFNDTHLITQSWDPVKASADPQAFIKDIVSRIDLNRSFGPTVTTIEKAEIMLESMVKRLDRVDTEKGSGRFSVLGGKKAIIFKDGDGAYDMMVKYGYSDLMYGLESGINKMGKKTGLVKVFGNDVQRGITDLENYMQQVFTTSQDLRSGYLAQFRSGIGLMQGSGNSFRDPNGGLAKLSKAVDTGTTLTYLTSLGSSAPKILMDVPLTILTAKAQGTSLPKATSRAVIGLIESMVESKASRKELAREMFQLMDSHKLEMFADQTGPFEAFDANRFVDGAFKLYGLSWVGQSTQNAAVRVQAKGFSDIIKEGPKGNRLRLQSIKRAGFSGSEMSMLRRMMEESNTKLLTPYDVQYSLAPNISKDVRADLANRLGTHIQQLVNESITTTDTRLQVALGKDLPKDSVKRMAFKVFSTFMTSAMKEQVNVNKAIRTISPEGRVRPSRDGLRIKNKTGVAVLTSAMITLALADFVTDELKKYISGTYLGDEDVTEEQIKKNLIDSGGSGLLTHAVIKMAQGQSPVGKPAILSNVGKLSTNIEDEWKAALGDRKTARRLNKKGDFLERQMDFLLSVSVEKIWATGLIKSVHDSIIEDVGKRHSSRRRRR